MLRRIPPDRKSGSCFGDLLRRIAPDRKSERCFGDLLRRVAPDRKAPWLPLLRGRGGDVGVDAGANGADEVQAAPESCVANAASLAENAELVGPGEPEDIIYFCMLGWSGIIKFDENGAPTYYGYPDPDCPIFRYFMII